MYSLVALYYIYVILLGFLLNNGCCDYLRPGVQHIWQFVFCNLGLGMCFLNLMSKILLVCPTYILGHTDHVSVYTPVD